MWGGGAEDQTPDHVDDPLNLLSHSCPKYIKTTKQIEDFYFEVYIGSAVCKAAA